MRRSSQVGMKQCLQASFLMNALLKALSVRFSCLLGIVLILCRKIGLSKDEGEAWTARGSVFSSLNERNFGKPVCLSRDPGVSREAVWYPRDCNLARVLVT